MILANRADSLFLATWIHNLHRQSGSSESVEESFQRCKHREPLNTKRHYHLVCYDIWKPTIFHLSVNFNDFLHTCV